MGNVKQSHSGRCRQHILRILKYIHAYSGLIKAYSETWHIENPGMFRTEAYSESSQHLRQNSYRL